MPTRTHEDLLRERRDNTIVTNFEGRLDPPRGFLLRLLIPWLMIRPGRKIRVLRADVLVDDAVLEDQAILETLYVEGFLDELPSANSDSLILSPLIVGRFPSSPADLPAIWERISSKSKLSRPGVRFDSLTISEQLGILRNPSGFLFCGIIGFCDSNWHEYYGGKQVFDSIDKFAGGLKLPTMVTTRELYLEAYDRFIASLAASRLAADASIWRDYIFGGKCKDIPILPCIDDDEADVASIPCCFQGSPDTWDASVADAIDSAIKRESKMARVTSYLVTLRGLLSAAGGWYLVEKAVRAAEEAKLVLEYPGKGIAR